MYIMYIIYEPENVKYCASVLADGAGHTNACSKPTRFSRHGSRIRLKAIPYVIELIVF